MVNTNTKKIAILGATSHIAKAIIYALSGTNKYSLYLFARNPLGLCDFVLSNGIRYAKLDKIEHFASGEYDVVINCVGIGKPLVLRETKGLIFRLTEEFDNLILDYMGKYSLAKYINLSSGAVYGSEFQVPANTHTKAFIEVNNIKPQDYYGIAKAASEAKHRAYSNLSIVDLRVFSFFSRFIDLSSGYLLTDIINHIREKKELITDDCSILRDYVHLDDFSTLVLSVINGESMNRAIDVRSTAPISKSEMLEFYSANYGLLYRINDKMDYTSVTGLKEFYYSVNDDYKGYLPKYSSQDCIREETKYFFG